MSKSFARIFAVQCYLERKALAAAERSAGLSDLALAGAVWETAKKYQVYANELDFFGELHPLFQDWEKEAP